MPVKIIALIFSVAISSNSLALSKHAHGEVELKIAADGMQVMLEIKAPGNDLVGFEVRPKTKKQKQKIESLKKSWEKDAFGMLSMKDQFKDCKVTKSDLEFELEGKHHAHVHATKLLSCEKTVKGRVVDINLKEKYKKIHEIHTTILSADGKMTKKEIKKQTKIKL